MRALYLVHIVGASLALFFGYVALFSPKGGPLHRRLGRFFVYAIAVMCAGGFVIALVKNVAPEVNIPAATLTSYLAITALTTVRPVTRGIRRLELGALLLALGLGLTCVTLAIVAMVGGASPMGLTTFPFLLFGSIGLLGATGDIRVLRTGRPHGPARLHRHLWRMCIALWIAATSFFFGGEERVPEFLRNNTPLRTLPVLAVMLVMFYWMWRVRRKKWGRVVVERVIVEDGVSVA
jgi:uncharacterized membrane protein